MKFKKSLRLIIHNDVCSEAMEHSGDASVCVFFSGGGTREERFSIMVALLDNVETGRAYQFLLDATEAGILDKEPRRYLPRREWWAGGSVCGMYPDTMSLALSSIVGVYRRVTGTKKSKLDTERIDREEELVLKARNGDFDELVDYLMPVCEYLSKHFVDSENKAYFSFQDVQREAFLKLSEKNGAFVKMFNSSKSSIKTWVSYCLYRELSKKTKKIEDENKGVVSLETSVHTGTGARLLIDTIPDEPHISVERRYSQLECLLNSMDKECERKVIEERWLHQRTLKNVAEEWGVSISKVCRMEKSAMKTLRRLARVKGLI